MKHGSLKLISIFVLLAHVAFSAAEASTNVSVMAYNVENLFDTQHDEGKKDWTYLPLSFKKQSAEVQTYCRSLVNPHYRRDCFNIDWSPALLSKKIANLARVIRGTVHGRGPDILVMEEVENLRALKQLRDEGLAGMGYVEAVLVEGPDDRGIDVGMLSRYPLARAPKLHRVDISSEDSKRTFETRGILEATFKVGGKLVTVLGNHWPSQQNPAAARVAAAKELNKIASQITDSIVIAAGDFNTLEKDEPNAIEQYVTNPRRKVSFFDVEAEKRNRSDQNDDLKPGTHFYRGDWSSLDRIFVLRSAVEGFAGKPEKAHVDWNSFSIFAADFMLHDTVIKKNGKDVTYEDVPMRFDYETGEGYTDHLPIWVALEL